MKLNETLQDMLSLHNTYNSLSVKLEKIKKQIDSLPYPRWIIAKWLNLYQFCEYREFTQEQARFILKVNGDAMVLSELHRHGLLDRMKSNKDKRVSVFKLKDQLDIH